MKEYTYHVDAGHGWLEVPYRDLLNSGMTLSQVSGFSYANVTDQYVPTLYLEEDCDMPRFLNALSDKGEAFNLVEQYHEGDCFVRNLERVE